MPGRRKVLSGHAWRIGYKGLFVPEKNYCSVTTTMQCRGMQWADVYLQASMVLRHNGNVVFFAFSSLSVVLKHLCACAKCTLISDFAALLKTKANNEHLNSPQSWSRKENSKTWKQEPSPSSNRQATLLSTVTLRTASFIRFCFYFISKYFQIMRKECIRTTPYKC
jgi:hypothetical protein